MKRVYREKDNGKENEVKKSHSSVIYGSAFSACPTYILLMYKPWTTTEVMSCIEIAIYMFLFCFVLFFL